MRVKKILFSLIFALLGIMCVTGSVFLLQGCSQSSPEKSGGGISENPESEDPEVEQKATSFNITLRIALECFDGKTYYSSDSDSQKKIARHAAFDFTWYGPQKEASLSGIKNDTWTTIESVDSGNTWTPRDTTGDTTRRGLVYMHFEYSTWPGILNRCIGITPQVKNNCVYYGVNGYNGSAYKYLYSNGKSLYATTSLSTAKSSCTNQISGTYTLNYKQVGNIKFYNSTTESQVQSAYTQYPGDNITTPTFTGTPPTGYHFSVWKNVGNSQTYSTGATIAVNSIMTYNNGDAFIPVFVANTYTISFSSNGGSGTMSSITATYDSACTISSNSFSKIGYTFVGWKATSGLNTSSTPYYYGTDSTWKTITSSTVINNNSKVKNLRATSGTVTLTAQWEINTYTLTIYYYGGTGRQTNTTNLSVTASTCSPSTSTTITSGSSATFTHSYTTTAQTIVFKLPSAGSYSYYLKTGSAPTTTSYSNLYTSSSNGYSITWMPTANKAISVYVYQRYTISYKENSNIYKDVDGVYKNVVNEELVATQYKIHGTAVSLYTNDYKTDKFDGVGWTTIPMTTSGWLSDTSGRVDYSSGQSYSDNKSITLYKWYKSHRVLIGFRFMVSTDGENYEYANSDLNPGNMELYSFGPGHTYEYSGLNLAQNVAQIGYSNTYLVTSSGTYESWIYALVGTEIECKRLSGEYVYVGWSMNKNSFDYNNSNMKTTVSSVEDSRSIYYLFFNRISNNRMKYDYTDKYYYFEDGYFPQSYVGDTLNSTLNNAPSSGLTLDRNLKYMDKNGETISIPLYTYNGNKYAKVTNNSVTKWFKVELIRWRVSEYGVSSSDVPTNFANYGRLYKNFKVVSNRVLWVGAVSRENTKEGWSFNSGNMRTYFSEIYKKNGASVSGEMPTFGISYNEKSYYYGPAGQQEKVKYTTSSYSGINIATEEEIKENLTDLRARASDMVAFILGLNEDSYCDYWTRELGGSLKNGKMITNSGMTKSAWLQNFYGVRFSLRMSEGTRV